MGGEERYGGRCIFPGQACRGRLLVCGFSTSRACVCPKRVTRVKDGSILQWVSELMSGCVVEPETIRSTIRRGSLLFSLCSAYSHVSSREKWLIVFPQWTGSRGRWSRLRLNTCARSWSSWGTESTACWTAWSRPQSLHWRATTLKRVYHHKTCLPYLPLSE